MGITIEKTAMYLGQTIFDIYGRKVGTIVGIYSEVDGKITAVEVMINDFNYETVPAERLELRDDSLKVLPEWFVEAQKVEKKLDTLKKRIKALEELYKKNQIPQHAYKELKDKLDKELNKVRTDVKSLKEVMKRRIYELENFILHIEKAMTNLMVCYTSGELPENGFKVSADHLRHARQTTLEERKEIEKHIGIITKLEDELTLVIKSLEESEKQEGTTLTIATQPGPITVKVTG